jgi:formamidase
VIRQLAIGGAEVLVRVSAYMDPWGATPPLDWWTVINRCRALENLAFVVAANQAASAGNFPPFSWPGGSMVVDFDGRILAQADPGPAEKIVVAPIDIAAVREARERRSGHQMLAHLRSEAFAMPKIFHRTSATADSPPSFDRSIEATKIARGRLTEEAARRRS